MKQIRKSKTGKSSRKPKHTKKSSIKRSLRSSLKRSLKSSLRRSLKRTVKRSMKRSLKRTHSQRKSRRLLSKFRVSRGSNHVDGLDHVGRLDLGIHGGRMMDRRAMRARSRSRSPGRAYGNGVMNHNGVAPARVLVPQRSAFFMTLKTPKTPRSFRSSKSRKAFRKRLDAILRTI